ncbi:hypothetical protein AAur_pTC10170 (plasmid) [Paenarthrobacter aurescens TC1]|nr:hypothetical protein AAur_pTC10170 [Paenarthrobacter aurescens TC1]
MTVVGERTVAPEPEGTEVPTGLTRRVFGVLVGAGVSGIIGGGSLLAASKNAAETGGISRGSGVWTSFGTVRIAAAERQSRLPQDLSADSSATAASSAPASGHDHGGGSAGSGVQPANFTWGDHVVLQVEVHNGMDRPVLFSPGQLRLKVGPGGPTVTNRSTGTGKGALEPGATNNFWISFLVPSDIEQLSAEFTDPWSDGDPLPLELPTVLRRPGWLENNHG